jgi:hypothetical protein
MYWYLLEPRPANRESRLKFFLIFSFPPRKFRDISIGQNLILTNSSVINGTYSLRLCTVKPAYIGRFRFLSKLPILQKWPDCGHHYEQCESWTVHYRMCKETVMVQRQEVEFESRNVSRSMHRCLRCSNGSVDTRKFQNIVRTCV